MMDCMHENTQISPFKINGNLYEHFSVRSDFCSADWKQTGIILNTVSKCETIIMIHLH